jgi:hypothetical protein
MGKSNGADRQAKVLAMRSSFALRDGIRHPFKDEIMDCRADADNQN